MNEIKKLGSRSKHTLKGIIYMNRFTWSDEIKLEENLLIFLAEVL